MFFGNVVYSICQWGLISLFAKETTPESVGEYALAVAITAPLLYIGNFNIGVMFVTDVDEKFSFSQYRTARFLLTSVSVVMAAVICALSRFGAQMFAIVMLTSLTQATECLSELYRMAMLREEQMVQIAFSLVARGLLSIGAAGVILFERKNLLWALTGIAASRVLVLLAYDIPVAHMLLGRRYPRAAEAEVRQARTAAVPGAIATLTGITAMALPLTIVTVLTSLMLNTPRYFIEHYLGPRELGFFAAMWSLLTAGNMIAISMGQAIFPRLAKLYAEGELNAVRAVISSATKSAVGLGACGVACAILVGRQVLTLAYGAEYAQNRWMFVAIMATGTLTYVITLLGNAATSARAFRQQALLMGLVTLTTLAASAVLTARFGTWGAIGAINVGLITHLTGLSTIVAGTLRQTQPRIPEESDFLPEQV